MKKIHLSFPVLAALAVVMLTPTISHAQIKFGIRGGLNVTNISFDNLPNRGERLGFHIGVFADLPLIPDFISVQPELSYSVKGAAFKPLNERRKINMNYVDLLVPVAFKLGSIDIQVGPLFSYLTSTPDYTVYEDNTLVIGAFRKPDVGLTAGLSYNFDHLLIGIRYNQGLVDVTKDISRPFLGSGKNAVGQISLGYRF